MWKRPSRVTSSPSRSHSQRRETCESYGRTTRACRGGNKENVAFTQGIGNEGLFRTYYVTDTFFVTTETTWQDIESHVTGYGESIILQTCVGDHEHYRVVVAC